MKRISAMAIYVIWLREMKRFIRAKSRLIGTLAMPLFFLAFLGAGFSKMPVPGLTGDVSYIQFLVPGIVGMSMLFTSTFAGVSVLWDREFGFLKEIMVAPVSRVSILLGRVAGNATTSMLQGSIIMLVSIFLGFKVPGILQLLLALVFLALISVTFIGLGLTIASNMKDTQGFGLVVNFIIFPLFFLSGALYPTENLPGWIRGVSQIDPLTYGIDGLRGVLIGASSLPIAYNLLILTAFSLVMMFLGTYFFSRNESV